jgi:hypothetical protein
MWKYREQASWPYSEEDFALRLNYIASALVSWGVVASVQVRARWAAVGGGGCRSGRGARRSAGSTRRAPSCPLCPLFPPQTQLAATKERPRTGKAVSIFLEVPPERAAEWFGA